MPEIIHDKKIFSLLEVTLSVQRTLAERYRSSFWVKAEMNKLNYYTYSGHCYPELVEKKDGKVIAQLKASLWKNDFNRINAKFLKILKEPLKDGITILFCATIQFDPSHGLSLRMVDIDPAFSLGELEREKQDTIEKLTKEGIFHNNKRLTLPLLPQRIAVISVETSKGYADYLNVLDHNSWGYKFFNFLFPSLLQGEKSVTSIRDQLRRIKKVTKHFDVVAIIRGGGGDVGLSSYNHYELAREIALFPIPVITGIGHSTNDTVAEMVSYKNAITPTELADFLIQKFNDFAAPVNRSREVVIDRAKRLVREEKLRFRNTIKYFQSVTRNRLIKCDSDVQSEQKVLIQQSKFLLKQEEQSLNRSMLGLEKCASLFLLENQQQVQRLTSEFQRQVTLFLSDRKSALQHIDKNIDILNPVNILKRGFTITLLNGKAVKGYSEVSPGDTMTTILADGQIVSTVKNSTKPEENA